MPKFIEVVDVYGESRLINVNSISDIVENVICFSICGPEGQIYLKCENSYTELKNKLMSAGVVIY